ncbi:hypothetical protein [Pseudonocardia nigra]|uniref:hypothetical protein n=1 Tax=Pseudonocardia nigra TaxID=1921578 RepID=UPI001C5E6D1C|nr:hypothetical protein [Pseudonocardia nigra]
MLETWAGLEGSIPAAVFVRVRERLADPLRSAREWRDQVCAYFLRKSGVPDARGADRPAPSGARLHRLGAGRSAAPGRDRADMALQQESGREQPG